MSAADNKTQPVAPRSVTRFDSEVIKRERRPKNGYLLYIKSFSAYTYCCLMIEGVALQNGFLLENGAEVMMRSDP